MIQEGSGSGGVGGGSDDILDAIRRDVTSTGWHVVRILEEDDELRWSFTVGLDETFGQAEVIVFGLEGRVAHAILNGVGELVCDGSAFRDGAVSREVLDGHPVAFRTVAEAHQGEFVGTALRYYERSRIPLLQLFWPDREGRFPWEETFDAPEDPRFRQPLLFRPPEAHDPDPG